MTFSEGITWRGLAGVARLAWLATVRLSFLCLGGINVGQGSEECAIVVIVVA